MLHSLLVISPSGIIDTTGSQDEFCRDLQAMNQNPSPLDSNQNFNQNLPPVGKAVRVRHNGLERIAYLDAQGKWRNYDTGDLLREEVTILSLI